MVVILAEGEDARILTMKGIVHATKEELKKKGVEIPEQEFRPAVLDGQRAIVMNTAPSNYDRSDDFWFDLATHEGFHWYEQYGNEGGTPWPGLSGRQGGLYENWPLINEARVSRAMTYNALAAVYRHPKEAEKYLAAAAYWRDQWKQHAPNEEEMITRIDIVEGTAKYVENVVGAIARSGDESGRRDRLLELHRPYGKFEPLTGESYSIGTAAGVVLDAMVKGTIRTKGNPGDWQNDIVTGRHTPLQRVLVGIAPHRESESDELHEQFKAAQEIVAKEYKMVADRDGPGVRAAIAGYDDRSHPIIKIDLGLVAIAEYALATYRVSGISMLLQGIEKGSLKTGTGSLELAGARGFQDSSWNLQIPLDPAHIKIDGEHLEITSCTIKGSLAVETTVSEGRTVYTIKKS
ncbi:hypothetical protein ACODT3_40595 [Streptomyces sp. 4.24]|uniref:hypothetical protein n=1 Tax=Streptomyces tritrimontium TaxID=3406573 RepID=UPI003BB7EF45